MREILKEKIILEKGKVNNFELTFNKSVGAFIIGEPMVDLLSLLKLEYDFYEKANDSEYSESFYDILELGLSVYVNDDDIITSINCYKFCYYNNVNVIGLNIDDLILHISTKLNKTESYYVGKINSKEQKQKVYDFDEIGLQVWVYRNKVVNIHCCNFRDDIG